MVNLPNFLIPLAIGLIGWFGALALDVASGMRRRPQLFAVIALGVVYLAANPPLVAIVALWVVALPVVAAGLTGSGRAGARRVAVFLGWSACWALPLALWWLVPYVLALRSAAAGGTITANTDVLSWSWTHANHSMDRVLTLVAKWSWPDQQFGSNASTVGAGVWRWLAFALPIGLVISPLVARVERRRAALWAVLATCLLAFLGKGLHAPLSGVNQWMFVHLPGMWLLREPLTKVGPLLALACIVGWALSADGLMARARALGPRNWRGRRRVRCAVVALVGAPVLFAWPMFTGSVIAGADRVQIPSEWRAIAAVVNDSPVTGNALVLPLDDFYQLPTTWGYYGTDTLVRQLLTRPTIVRNPQAYIGASANYEDLLLAAEASLVGRDADAFTATLRALGVSHVIVRKDIDYDSPIRKVDMPTVDELLRGVAGASTLTRLTGNSVADVFEVDGGAEPVRAVGGLISAPGLEGQALAALVASAPPDLAVTVSDHESSALTRGEAWYVDLDAPTAPELADTEQAWTYRRHSRDAPLLELRAQATGLEVRDALMISAGDTRIASRPPTTIAASGRVTGVEVDGALVDLGAGRAFIRPASGARLTPYVTGALAQVSSQPTLGDCNRYDDRTPEETGIDAGTVSADGYTAIRLAARAHSSCATYAMAGVAGGDVVRVEYEQRAVSGSPPRTCLWQAGVDRCAPLALTATRDGDWFRMSALYRVPADVGQLSMFMYADEPASGADRTTEAWYRNLRVERLVPGTPQDLAGAGLAEGTFPARSAAAGVTATLDVDDPALDGRWDLADCARTDDRTLEALGIRASGIDADDPMAVRLEAKAHSACAVTGVVGLQPAVSYELGFTAEVVQGARPRVCVWETALQECARFDLLHGPTNGAGEYRYRGRVASGAGNVRLFLYADAAQGGTAIEYRDVALRAVTDESLVILPEGARGGDVPEVTWRRVDPGRYEVEVVDATAPFVLVLGEAWSQGWRVRGLPADAAVEHLELDGYRNGWTITAQGDLDLVLEYHPASYGRAARKVSAATAVALVGSLFLTPVTNRVRRRRRRRPHPRPAPTPRTRARRRTTRMPRRTRRRSPVGPPEVGSRRVPLPDDWLLPER
jgi:arabinofuranan 3-O-arabinosyltransferase